ARNWIARWPIRAKNKVIALSPICLPNSVAKLYIMLMLYYAKQQKRPSCKGKIQAPSSVPLLEKKPSQTCSL
ncbi:hypothetical protein P7L93_24665, partial [Vibrio parahaemolyticus]|nr:hypothetical protein [Vibrio parahaemolyticus]